MVVDDVFAVIAEPTRRHILVSLRDGDKAVGELVQQLEVSQPTVSKHLKVLREAGLVSMRAQGQKRFYSLNAEPLEGVASWLAEFQPAVSAEHVLAPAVIEADLEELLVARSGAGNPEAVQPFGRTVGRAAERAADLLSQFPKLRRRKE
ncbi:metalloregulator ArsR/SmtB family transcription factor [Arthrobacter sp. JZ12]|uniref:ArsR/SmtB family transcription factor n=1 Tax=Arthrobacter sp. JZ12 TaxID=2654190 RepID=UPI002B49D4E1|nr:metalloregulator ArsR/SmtB family transcription factor [Arthrobacter sp. JZ12]WRH25754.1 metalloregulator ArsR/SmtB family transcription factor [Arthrobacter sp. JZ12]